ncbi:MAG: hypothetical protein HFE83_01030 [Lachnospiraceae bacterium]|nr:hypothetical protein [Lachnospiraceae bacterium]
MDISPLYKLQTRLTHMMLSGCGLLEEDFRLKRAVEAMKPLETASPVFARIGQLLGRLSAADKKERPGALLDALTLVDAVILTQGAVDVPSKIEEIQIARWGSAVMNAPYSVLHALLDALGTSGGGRYSFVMETHKEHPELFEDYRVKPALVKALGSSYPELAEQVMRWLKESGPELLVLLSRDFDPKGKKEMVRRVAVIEDIAGPAANVFYREQLAEAEKEVRTALIYALRHSQENEELLLELAKTERGAHKKAALWALALMDGEKTAAFWADFAAQKPQEAFSYLTETTRDWASALTAAALKKWFMPWAGSDAAFGQTISLTKEEDASLTACFRTLRGKSGWEAGECWRLAAGLEKRFARPDRKEGVTGRMDTIPGFFLHCLLYRSEPELGRLAVSCFEDYGETWFAAAAAAKLLFAPEEECINWLDRHLYKRFVFGEKRNGERIGRLLEVFNKIVWNEKTASYKLRLLYVSDADGRQKEAAHRIPQGIVEGYLTELLTGSRDSRLDGILFGWIQPGNREYCGKLCQYFYNQARTVSDNRVYLEPLRQCGAGECGGLAVKYFMSRGNIQAWEAWNYLNRLPGSWDSRLKEAEAVLGLVKSGRVKENSYLKERIEEYIGYARTQAAIHAGEEKGGGAGQ